MASQSNTTPVSALDGQDNAGQQAEVLENSPTPASPHVIAFLSQKGGPGKTTTSINLAAALVMQGQACLVIDIDPQRAAGRCLGVSVSSSADSIYAVLTGIRTLREIVAHTQSGVDVAPSHPNLAALSFDTRASREARLKLAIESLLQEADYPPYPFILIDCPPDLDVMSANALIAATNVVIPVEPEPLSLFTLADVLMFIRDVRLVNPRLQVMGFVVNKVSKRRQAQTRQTLIILAQLPHPVLGHVHDSAHLVRAPETGRTIFQIAPNSVPAGDYRKLAEVICNGCN